MKIRKSLLFAVAALVAPTISSANLINNGSFESYGGTGFNSNIGAGITGWTISGGGIDIVTQSTWQAADGVASITLGWTSPATITQTLATTSGQAYDLSFFMAAEIFGGSALRTMQVIWNGSVVSSPSFPYTGQGPAAMGWTQKNLIVVGTGSDVLQFRSTTTTAPQYGPALDNVRLTAMPATISGTLTLGDTIGSSGTTTIDWTLSNTVNTYTGSVVVTDFGTSSYTLPIPGAAPAGAYTLKFKGGSFLAKTLNVTLSGASLTSQNAILENGDVDQNGEVGPSDFELVIAQFGEPGTADADNNGEVGPSDFEIVVANFGIGDE